MKKIYLVALAVLALGIVGAVAYASIPGPDGVIHACYKNSNPAQGALIAIDSSASCPSGYTALNWNQTGPTGSAGTNGTNGTNGVSGYEIVHQQVTLPYNVGNATTFVVSCPTGKVPLAGGYKLNPDASGNIGDVASQYPDADGVSWDFVIYPGTNSVKFPDLYVTCALAGLTTAADGRRG
jgi:hypothetical protein